MSAPIILATCALVCSIILFANHETDRMLSVLTILVAIVEALIAFRFVTIRVSAFYLGLIPGSILAVTGTLQYLRVRSKLSISAATLVTFVGVMQVLMALRFHR